MKTHIFWLAAALAAALALAAANLVFGNLNQDEGWYLYAARLIATGQVPYRDFAFTQGPVMPYVYAFFQPVINWGGLAAGRGITALLGLAGAVLAAVLAGKLASSGLKSSAALLCFSLVAVNVYQSYFCTVVKTYSLSILLLVLAFLLLHRAIAGSGGRIAVMLSAALLALAAATRASAAVALPIVFCLLLWERRKIKFPAWLYFFLGGAIVSVLVLGPFLAKCPFNFYYFAGRYHSLREGGGLAETLVFKCGFLSRVFQAYFVCFAVWLAALAIKLTSTTRGHPEQSEGSPPHKQSWQRFLALFGMTPHPSSLETCHSDLNRVFPLLKRALWLCAIAISLVHFFAPFPYDDYEVFVYPLFAVAVSAMIIGVMPAQAAKYLLPAIFCLCLVSSTSSPINQDWFIEGRELIWWKAKDSPQLSKLRKTSDKIRSLCKPGDLLLTQDPYLAVESGTTLPHGLELGQFSYFPDLTREQALKLNVLNRELMIELLEHCPAKMAALSGYAFAMKSPAVSRISAEDKATFLSIISNRYESIEIAPNFGQASTELRLYRKK